MTLDEPKENTDEILELETVLATKNRESEELANKVGYQVGAFFDEMDDEFMKKTKAYLGSKGFTIEAENDSINANYKNYLVFSIAKKDGEIRVERKEGLNKGSGITVSHKMMDKMPKVETTFKGVSAREILLQRIDAIRFKIAEDSIFLLKIGRNRIEFSVKLDDPAPQIQNTRIRPEQEKYYMKVEDVIKKVFG